MKKSYSDMTLRELRDNGYCVIVWTPDDVQTLRSDWSLDECALALDKIDKHLVDRSIEFGWDVMDILLDENVLND